MIGQLRGLLIQKQPPLLMLDVQGVGYEVLAPMSTFYSLPELQQPATLLTHLIVREDQHTLYGFNTDYERELFKTLIKVNGVGPKLALAILSGIESDEFIRCVHDNEPAGLIRIPGVGKKTAERLIIEMRDKLPECQIRAGHSLSSQQSQSIDDAIAALNALGYKPQEARKAVKAIEEPDLSSEKLIRLALQRLSQG